MLIRRMNEGGKNIFNKKLGRYQTQEDWQKWLDSLPDAYQRAAERYNQYGSDINWKANDKGYNLDYDGNLWSDTKDLAKDAYSQIHSFERGARGWATLDPKVQQWYRDRGFNPDTYTQKHRYETLDDWNAWKAGLPEQYRRSAERFNKYGSALDWKANDKGYNLDYEGNLWSDTKDLADDAYSQIHSFERGQRGWKLLDKSVQDWYLSKYDPADIVAEVDADGNPVTVAQLLPGSGLETTKLPGTDTTPVVSPAPLVTPPATPEVPEPTPVVSVSPTEVTRPTYNLAPFTPDPVHKVQVNPNWLERAREEDKQRMGSYDYRKYQGTAGGKNMGGLIKGYNQGNVVDYDAIGTADFGGEGISDALKYGLGNLAKFYQDQGSQPAWYGQQYNPETGQYDQLEGYDTVAGFTADQMAGRDSLRGASQTQADLANNYNQAVQAGIQGGYSYNPALGQSALQGQANYVNQYLDPAVQQAQQGAIANVNASFGQGGTLGGARNARAASTAASQASLPILQQGALTEFQAQNQRDAANQAAMNQFALANQGALNQAAQYNLNNVGQWADRTGTAQQQSAVPGQTLQEIGQQGQDLDQARINENVKAWNWGQNLEQQQLWNLLGLGQLQNAAQNQGLTARYGSGGFNLGNALQQGLYGGLQSGISSGIGSLLGGLFNTGGLVSRRKVGG